MNSAVVEATSAESLTSLIEKAESDPQTLKRVIADPLAELESLGIEVEEEFRGPVAVSLKSFAQTLSEKDKPVAIPLAAAAGAKPAPFYLYVRPWGVVLRLDETATGQVKGGMGFATGVAAAVTAACATAPDATLSKFLAVVIGLFTAALAAYAGLIDLIDRGKGVYLTVTWPQIIIPGAAIPIITPVA